LGFSHVNQHLLFQVFVTLQSGQCSGPLPGFGSRGGQKPEGGAHFLNTVVDVCSNRRAKREMGGHRYSNVGPGTTGPPAGDGPGGATSFDNAKY